jgi:hypothetical protein
MKIPRNGTAMLARLLTTYRLPVCVIAFIIVMAFVRLGAERIVTSYGLPGTLATIGIILWIATLMERRR